MRNGKTLVQLAQEIERQKETKNDYIVPSGEMEMVAYEGHIPTLRINGYGEHGITDTGHETLASRLGIPAGYYDKMRAETPALLAYNVNTWAKREGEQGISRMVCTLDGNARAVLSDRYRRMDNCEFLEAVLPAIQSAGVGDVEVQSTEITERRMYLQLTFAGLETEFDIQRGGRQVGEVVRAGLILKNRRSKCSGGVYRLAQNEQVGILRHLVEGGDLSHYGLVNALIRTAQDMDSYDRAVELEELGGTLLEMPVRQLQPILVARAA